MDAETGLLPAEFTYTGIGLGLLFSWLVPGDSSGTEFLLRVLGIHAASDCSSGRFLDAIVAMLFGAAFFYSIWALYYLVRKRHGLGFGDIALIAMCGAFLGLKLTLFVLFAAPILGSVYAHRRVGLECVGPEQSHGDGQATVACTTADMLRVGEAPFWSVPRCAARWWLCSGESARGGTIYRGSGLS